VDSFLTSFGDTEKEAGSPSLMVDGKERPVSVCLETFYLADQEIESVSLLSSVEA
jgi:hypothetical protein